MAVNVKLLQKVRGLIAEEPRRLDMDYWGINVADMQGERPSDPPPCGTIACLAGWCVFAARPELREIKVPLNAYLWEREHKDIEDEAANLMGIPRRDCPFYAVDWQAPEVLAWIDRQIDAAK